MWQIGAAANVVLAAAFGLTLASARQISSTLLGESGTELALGPGELVRQAPAVVAPIGAASIHTGV